MRIDDVFEDPINEGIFDKINPFSDQNKQYVVDGPLGRIEIPQWLSRAWFELDASLPFDLTVMAFPIAAISGRVAVDLGGFLMRVKRNHKLLAESTEFEEAFRFIRSMKQWGGSQINTEQDARRAIADIKKATKLVNKFANRISKEDIPFMERSKLMRDVSYLYDELDQYSFVTMAKAEAKLKEKHR